MSLSMFSRCSLDVLSMFSRCSLDVLSMFSRCSLDVLSMFSRCSLDVSPGWENNGVERPIFVVANERAVVAGPTIENHSVGTVIKVLAAAVCSLLVVWFVWLCGCVVVWLCGLCGCVVV
jgi:hypothetical protein